MQKRISVVSIVFGAIMISLSMGAAIVDRIKADGCSSGCTSNNNACYGNDYAAVCKCNNLVSGRTWADSPTYGSTTGNTMISFSRKICYIEHACMATPMMNHKCTKIETGNGSGDEYGCVVEDGYECPFIVNMQPAIRHMYRNCDEGMCIEE